MAGTSLDFSLNEFQQQKTFSEAMGWAYNIINLLYLKPGNIPSQPTAGIDIVRRYRWKDADTITSNAFREEIITQIKQFLPSVPLVELKLYVTNHKGQGVLIMEFYLTAAKVITIGMAKNMDVVNFKINIQE